MPSSPRGVCRLSGQKRRTRPYRRHPGRCGHRPLQKTTCLPSVGGDALIAPWGTTPERSRKTDTSIPLASGPMWASAPTKNNVRFQRRGRCPHRPVGYVVRAGGKTDTPVPSASGPMWASAPTKNNVRFQRRVRCPHRPVGCVSGAVRKDGHAHPVGIRADVGCIDRYDCLQIVRGDRLQFK